MLNNAKDIIIAILATVMAVQIYHGIVDYVSRTTPSTGTVTWEDRG